MAVFRGTRAVVTLLLVLIVPVWVLLSQAASKNFYFELAGAASVLSGRRWLIVLGLPGVLAGGWFLFAPSSHHGAALLYFLGGSVVAAVVTAALTARDLVRSRG